MRLEMDAGLSGEGLGDPEFMRTFEARYHDLVRRITEEPGVRGITVAEQLPGAQHRQRTIEFEGPQSPRWSGIAIRAQVAAVDANFFDVMGSDVLAGRGFGAADLNETSRAVVVNESFARTLAGGNAVGQRFRYTRDAEPTDSDVEQPWLEIVGVVSDIPMSTDPTLEHNSGIYHIRVAAVSYPVRLAVHLGDRAEDFSGRLRDLARQTSPELRVHHTMSLDQAGQGVRAIYEVFFRLLFFMGGLALLLTIAGIYSTLALTVSRRTREIGVRVALGADRRSLVLSILSRMAPWIAVGALLGSVLGVRLALLFAEIRWAGSLANWGQVTIYFLAMMVACLLPCVVPIRRALAIEPSEALAAEV